MAALAAPDDQPVKRDVQVVLDLKRTRAANEVAANAIEHGRRPGDEIEICRTLRRDRLGGSACRELREVRRYGVRETRPFEFCNGRLEVRLSSGSGRR
jgi:hypothetical protein